MVNANRKADRVLRYELYKCVPVPHNKWRLGPQRHSQGRGILVLRLSCGGQGGETGGFMKGGSAERALCRAGASLSCDSPLGGTREGEGRFHRGRDSVTGLSAMFRAGASFSCDSPVEAQGQGQRFRRVRVSVREGPQRHAQGRGVLVLRLAWTRAGQAQGGAVLGREGKCERPQPCA